MTNLSDPQAIVLSAAAQRPDGNVLPLQRRGQRRYRRAPDGRDDDRRIEPEASRAIIATIGQRIVGWAATAIMAAAALAMFAL